MSSPCGAGSCGGHEVPLRSPDGRGTSSSTRGAATDGQRIADENLPDLALEESGFSSAVFLLLFHLKQAPSVLACKSFQSRFSFCASAFTLDPMLNAQCLMPTAECREFSPCLGSIPCEKLPPALGRLSLIHYGSQPAHPCGLGMTAWAKAAGINFDSGISSFVGDPCPLTVLTRNRVISHGSANSVRLFHVGTQSIHTSTHHYLITTVVLHFTPTRIDTTTHTRHRRQHRCSASSQPIHSDPSSGVAYHWP